MGRVKGYSLSPERIKRMQMAKSRRKLGYTKHLHIVEELIQDKMEEVFKKWNLDIEDSLFIIEPYDQQFEFLPNMQEKDLEFMDAIKKAVELLKRIKVSEVGIICYDEEVLVETDKIGSVVFIRKKGFEYLVEYGDEIKI